MNDSSAAPIPTDGQELAANIVNGISSAMAMIATLIICIRFITKKQLYNFESKLIFFLCLDDFFKVTAMCIPQFIFWAQGRLPLNQAAQQTYSATTFCKVFGTVELFTCLGQCTWTFAIAFSIFRGTKPESEIQYKRRKYILYAQGIGIPLILTILQVGNIMNSPVAFNKFGQDSVVSTVCFVAADSKFLFLSFGFPMIFYMFLNLYLFIRVIKYIRQNIERDFAPRVEQKLIVYPLILILGQGWYCIYYMVDAFYRVYWYNYQIFANGCCNLVGFFDALYYGFNSQQNQETAPTLSVYSLLTQPLTERALSNNSLELNLTLNEKAFDLD